MAVIFIASVVDICLKRPSYFPWIAELGGKPENPVPYSAGIMFLIVFLVLSSLICFPLILLLNYFNIYKADSFAAKDSAGSGVCVGEDITESQQPLTAKSSSV